MLGLTLPKTLLAVSTLMGAAGIGVYCGRLTAPPAAEVDRPVERTGPADSRRVSPAEESPRPKVAKIRAAALWQEALRELRAGNQRFVVGSSKHPHESPLWRHRLEHSQQPFATILGCADSRVCPELVFDQGFGDLFVIRVAGNVVDPDVAGSVEYAVDHLGTPLMVVLGHEQCGAVTAALDAQSAPMDEPREILSLLRHIEPACRKVSADCPREEQIAVAVEANVRHSIRRLERIDDIREALAAGRVHIVGAIYDLHTGTVRFLD